MATRKTRKRAKPKPKGPGRARAGAGATAAAGSAGAGGAARAAQRRDPESLRLRSMAASLTVDNLERSTAWYRDVLGFTVGERWEEHGAVRGVQLKAGACDLMLGQDDFAKGRGRKKGEGFRLWVSTVQDIDAIAARVKQAGWPLDREPSDTPWGDWAFALTDPDGFKITVIQE